MEILHEGGRLDDEVLAALAADELVAGLLVVHGLHPYGVEERVERALEAVRPYLGSHGGDVELLGVSEEGVVRLRLLGSCDGCPSSSVTLELAVEGAIHEAAPEVSAIEIETAADTDDTGPLISVDSLFTRLEGSGEHHSGARAGCPSLSWPGCPTARWSSSGAPPTSSGAGSARTSTSSMTGARGASRAWAAGCSPVASVATPETHC